MSDNTPDIDELIKSPKFLNDRIAALGLGLGTLIEALVRSGAINKKELADQFENFLPAVEKEAPAGAVLLRAVAEHGGLFDGKEQG